MPINNNKKKDDLVRLIIEVISMIKNMIEKDVAECCSFDIKQLSYIRSVLEDVFSELNSEDWSGIDKKLNISRIVINTLKPNDILGNKICQIEYEFDRLKNSLRSN